MSDFALEQFRPVTFDIARLHVLPRAEILREPLRDSELVYRLRQPFLKEFDRILLMASGKSASASQWVKNHLLGQVAITAMGTLYFALWTTAATTDMDAYVGNTAGEVASLGSYDRVGKTNNTTNFASISGDAAKVNSNAITWTAASANWNSGNTIPQLGVLDGNAKTGSDNFVIWGDFTTAKSVLSGDTATINTSSLSYTEE